MCERMVLSQGGMRIRMWAHCPQCFKAPHVSDVCQAAQQFVEVFSGQC